MGAISTIIAALRILRSFATEVVKHGAAIGLAFDGDADRLIAIDENGEEVDGDFILSILGDALNRTGKLNHGTIVTTVMANIGFFKGIEKAGLKLCKPL